MVNQVNKAMMSQLAHQMDVRDLDPPIRYTVGQGTATLAQRAALQHHVRLPRDVARIIGGYTHGDRT
jgi:hypothetical protein